MTGADDCDDVSTTCNNNIGSFTCECKSGFVPMTPSMCEGQW